MSYLLPRKYFPKGMRSLMHVARDFDKDKTTIYPLSWDSEHRTLSCFNERTGIFIALRVRNDEFSLNFLPPRNAMLTLALNTNSFVYELETVPYYPCSKAMKQRYNSDYERYARYRLKHEEYSTREMQRAIKHATRGRITKKSLIGLSDFPYEIIDIFWDRAELRTANRDALMIVPTRTVKFYKQKKAAKDALEFIE